MVYAVVPKAFRETRVEVTKHVEQAVIDTDDLRKLTPELLLAGPRILQTLRMSCCPPLAVDRLVGLAYTSKSLVGTMEEGKLALRMAKGVLRTHLENILAVITKLLRPHIFVWLPENRKPTKAERHRASTIVADRLTGAVANPIIKNAQEKRQLAEIDAYLAKKGYKRKPHPAGVTLTKMEPGTFCFHYAVATGAETHKVNVSVDVLIQPKYSCGRTACL